MLSHSRPIDDSNCVLSLAPPLMRKISVNAAHGETSRLSDCLANDGDDVLKLVLINYF